MTTKRFVDGGEECIEDQFLIDTSNDKYYWVSDGLDGIVKLLNELHEDYQDAITTLFKVKEENEQLKTTIQQLRTDNTKQKKKLNTTMKKNEQLKCGNKNLKAILNDFINILNRLQSNPTDKQTLGVARDMLQNMGVDLE